MIKKYLITLLILLIPNISFALYNVPTISISTTPWYIYPKAINDIYYPFGADRFIATSTTGLGFFLGASTGNPCVSFDSPTFVVDCNNNRVGIGTTTPPNRLSIKAANIGASTVQGGLLLDATYSAGSSVQSIDFSINGNSSNLSARIANPTSGSNGQLSFYTTTNFTTVEPTEKMRIDASGNVGIGTTSPTSLLSITGSNTNTTLTTLGTPTLQIENSNTTANNFSTVAFRSIDSLGAEFTGSRISGIFTNHTSGLASGDMAFLTMNSGTISEKMRILANGSVGIGTTTPQALLNVHGATRITSNSSLPTSGQGLELVYQSSPTLSILTSFNRSESTYLPMSFRSSNFDFTSGNVGIGTSTPSTKLQVDSNTATTTISATVVSGSTRSTTLGGRIILQDTSGGTCTEIYTQTGVISGKAITCP